MRAAIYYRVSSQKQIRDGYGFPSQKRLLPAYCQQQGWEVAAEYEEPGISADTLTQRPTMLRLLEDAERGAFDVILSVEDTRLSRGRLSDAETIKALCDKHLISLATPAGIYYRHGNDDDDFTSDIRFAVSKREKKVIRRRTREGRLEKAQSGVMPVGRGCFGYRQVSVAEAKVHPERAPAGRLEIVEGQAQLVRELFARYARGETLASLVRWLNDTGARTPFGNSWERDAVRKILRRETYCGVRYFNQTEWLRDGKTWEVRKRERAEWVAMPAPPIVDRSLWEAVQARLDHNRENRRGRPTRRWLLSGCVFCGRCIGRRGSPLRCQGCQPPEHKAGSYACPNARIGGAGCNVRMDAERLHRTALAALRIAARPDALEAAALRHYRQQTEGNPLAELEAARGRLADLDRREHAEADNLAAGVAVHIVKERLSKIHAERAEAQAALVAAERRLAASPTAPDLQGRARQLAVEIAAALEGLDAASLQEAFQRHVRITILRGKPPAVTIVGAGLSVLLSIDIHNKRQ